MLAAIEMVIILLFLGGVLKKYTYGAVLVFHAISTFSSFGQYLSFDSLLFFAAWPMLAACLTLFLLRESDVRLTVSLPV
ncbi:MAG: hypothetical protein WDZ76_07300 [Pseudohongiellaceae bacterium]